MRQIFILLGIFALFATTPWWKSGNPEIAQTSAPQSVQEARIKCPIKLPEEATNVCYAFSKDVTSYECFVRFEIPYDKGVAYVKDLFREHAAKMNWEFVRPEGKPITRSPQLNLIPDKQLHVDWFDVSKIKNGLVFGEFVSWHPQVWLDKDRNLFFYCLTD